MLVLRTLGELSIENGGALSGAAGQRSRLALLAVLASASERGITREQVLALLWPESDETRARAALRQALYALRRDLGTDDLVLGTTQLRLNPAVVRSDVGDFLAAISANDSLRATELYRGPFLEGFYLRANAEFERWVDGQRRTVWALYVNALERLAEAAAAASDVAGAALYWQRRAEAEPQSGRVAKLCMKALAAAGDPDAGVRYAARYAKGVRDELGDEPDPSVVELANQLRRWEPRESPVSGRDEAQRAPIASAADLLDNAPQRAPPPTTRSPRRWILGGLAATAALGVMAAAGERIAAATLAPPSRFVLGLPDSVRVRDELTGTDIALSPDGVDLLYVGGRDQSRLYLRRLDDLTPHAIAGTEGATEPEYSPDGRWIAFKAHRDLMLVPAAGGAAIPLVSGAKQFALGDRGAVVYSDASGAGDGGLMLFDRATKRSTPLTHPDSARGETAHARPFVLPGGLAAIFEIVSGKRGQEPDSSEIAAVRFADHAVVRLGVHGCSTRFGAGHLLIGKHDGTIEAVPFDEKTLRVTGSPVTVLDHVEVKPGCATQLATGGNGTLVFIPAPGGRDIILAQKNGSSRRIGHVDGFYSTPRFSPDGRHIAVVEGDHERSDIWVVSVQTGEATRLTSTGVNIQPQWTADGSRLTWVTQPGTGTGTIVWSQPWDGSERAAIIARPRRGDGLRVLQGGVVSVVPMETVVAPDPDHPRVRPRMPVLSPDGTWLAYVLGFGGRVFVQRFGGDRAAAYQVSDVSGTDPVWDPSESGLYYRAAGKIVRARFMLTPHFVIVGRDTVLDDRFWGKSVSTSADIDISPDGTSFVAIETSDRRVEPVVLTAWTKQLLSGQREP